MKKLLMGIAFLVSLIGGIMPVDAKPPPWAPAHGARAKHHYYYYPAQQVYYYPARRQYFWLDGGAWKVGVRLPESIRIGSSRVSVDLDTPLPYTRHPEVIVRFPIGSGD